jgi:hypothetical protein
MARVRNFFLDVVGAALLLLPLFLLRADAQVDELLPEIDGFYKLNSEVRLSFQAKEMREGGDPTQAEFGPSVEFYLKPLIKLKDITLFDLDDAKSRPLVLTIGYRFLSSPTRHRSTVWNLLPPFTFH